MTLTVKLNGTSEPAEFAREWGWTNPPTDIFQIATQAKAAMSMMSAEFLVHMGWVTRQECERLLESKPQDVKTITWFAKQEKSNVPMERVMALMNGLPFYEHLTVLTVHPSMYQPDVMVAAEQIDAALMQIEGREPVMVFATFAGLLNFEAMGRSERASNALTKAADEIPKLAVASRDEISAVLAMLRSEDSGGSLESANVWNAEAPENKNSPEAREITRLIDHALAEKTTDISLRPFRDGAVKVQMRKLGSMIDPKSTSAKLNAELGTKIIRLLQSKSGANPTNTVQRTPSDGQITYRSSVGDAHTRLSFIPLNHLGEMRALNSVSIRLLPRSEESVSMAQLKLSDVVVEQISFAMQLSQGLVLVVGPTNSGKSTTIAGCIGEHVRLFGDSQKRLSVEDPIERFIYGVTQINVLRENQSLSDTDRWSVILRALKRHDPDVISIGEIRDQQTADLCVNSAITGHLALSTLHANDTLMAFDALAKTIDKSKWFQLIESLSVIIAQRLVKELCPHCCRTDAPTPADRKLFSRYLDNIGEETTLPEKIATAKVGGCDACGGDGFVGLLPLNEVLPFTRKVKDAAGALLEGGQGRSTLAQARPLTLLQSGMDLLRNHRIQLADLLV